MKKLIFSILISMTIISCNAQDTINSIIKHENNCKPISTKYNEVQQISSHNSYDKNGIKPGIIEQANSGVRSFEFDLHVGDTPYDWDIYHFTHLFSGGDNCDKLSQCFGLLRQWHNEHPDHEIITIWLQLVDDWKSNGHNEMDLDNKRLANDFGNLIFTPQNLLTASHTATDLQDAINKSSWPTLESLKGKFIIVLSGNNQHCADYLDDVANYKNDSVGNNGYFGKKFCFVAPENLKYSEDTATFTASNGNIINWKNAIFFNFSTNLAAEAKCTSEKGMVTRMFNEATLGNLFNCSIENEEEYNLALKSFTHHIVTNRVVEPFLIPRLIDNCNKPFRLINH